ncbi:MAG TPA: hypothetical protein VF310_14225, partial [Vicinamibacteria bacterium]
GTPWQNVRFALAYTPPLAVLIALGVARMGQVAGRWLLGLCLVAGLAWMAAGGVELTRGFIARKDAGLATVRWAQLPADARLFTFGLTLTFRHYSPVETYDLSELWPADLAPLLAGDRPAYLLLDVANVETQWRDRPPSENYHRLRDGPGLVPLGRRGPYTLFRIGASGARSSEGTGDDSRVS